MTKTLKVLTILITLTSCSDWAANLTPEQRALAGQLLLQNMAIQNSRPIGADINYDAAGIGMIGRANSPVYVCTAYGCP